MEEKLYSFIKKRKLETETLFDCFKAVMTFYTELGKVPEFNKLKHKADTLYIKFHKNKTTEELLSILYGINKNDINENDTNKEKQYYYRETDENTLLVEIEDYFQDCEYSKTNGHVITYFDNINKKYIVNKNYSRQGINKTINEILLNYSISKLIMKDYNFNQGDQFLFYRLKELNSMNDINKIFELLSDDEFLKSQHHIENRYLFDFIPECGLEEIVIQTGDYIITFDRILKSINNLPRSIKKISIFNSLCNQYSRELRLNFLNLLYSKGGYTQKCDISYDMIILYL